MRELRLLWDLCGPYRKNAIGNILFNIAASLFSVFSLLMLIPFLQVLFYGNADAIQRDLPQIPFFQHLYDNWIVVLKKDGQQAALLLLCVGLVLVFLLKNTFRYLALYSLVPLRTGSMMLLRNKIYNKLLRLNYPYFQKTRRGDILTRFGQDVQEVEYGIINFIEVGLKEPATIAITLASLIWMSPTLTLWVFLLLPVSALVIGGLGKMLKKQSSQAQEKLSLLQSLVDEVMYGIRIIRSLGAATVMEARFSKLSKEYQDLHTAMLRRKEMASPLSELLGITVVAILLLIGGKWVLSGDGGISPEVFITYLVVFSQIISPSKAFANAWYFIRKAIASLDRVNEILLEKEKLLPEKPINKNSFDEAIDIENLSFSFGEQLVLSNFHLHIPKGQKVAIVGPSGSGKSTLLHLLAGFYEQQKGAIKLDQTPIEQIHPSDFSKLYSFVTQEAVLFYGSVKENLLLAKQNASDEEIQLALKQAGAWSFVEEWKNGIHHNIGERGGQLSGGQQQRIALARAYLRDAPILLLDEATSALDAQTDEQIKQVIQHLSKDKTVIAIAHRLSSIQNYDRIIVLENGEITGDDTHSALLSNHHLYQEFVSGQKII